MTAEVLHPPRIGSFTKDNASSTSVYTQEAHNRFSMGDFIYQSNTFIHKRSSIASSQNSKEKPKKTNPTTKSASRTFPVARKNSYRGPQYYKLNNRPISQPVLTSPKSKRISKYSEPTQIDPVFNLFPEKSILENPTFMVQYFTKALDLVKQNPDIHYKVLKAEIQVNSDSLNNVARDNAFQKLSKAKKYQSLPVLSPSIKTETLEKKASQRKSAPVQLVYKETNMTMSEYLNTPLDIYQHKKKASEISNSDKSKETRGTHPSTESGVSVDTTALYPIQTNKVKSKVGRPLATKREGHVMKGKRILRQDLDDFPVMQRDPSTAQPRNISSLSREDELKKYGTPIIKNPNVGKVTWGQHPSSSKRHSDTANVSIATGDEIYNDIKSDVFDKRLPDWNAVRDYLNSEHPSVSDNSYFLCRLMYDIYLRRVLAARIALKLGSDKANRGESDIIWAGLKESIAAVYGQENAAFFESQTKQKVT
jgi:hypothetical protein